MTNASFPLHDDAASCAAYRPVLDDLVAGEVDAVTQARVEAHLATCAACRFALAQARAYRRMTLRAGHGERASPALRDRALELMRDVRNPRGPEP